MGPLLLHGGRTRRCNLHAFRSNVPPRGIPHNMLLDIHATSAAKSGSNRRRRGSSQCAESRATARARTPHAPATSANASATSSATTSRRMASLCQRGVPKRAPQAAHARHEHHHHLQGQHAHLLPCRPLARWRSPAASPSCSALRRHSPRSSSPVTSPRWRCLRGRRWTMAARGACHGDGSRASVEFTCQRRRKKMHRREKCKRYILSPPI
jgi:hypothetical protein